MSIASLLRILQARWLSIASVTLIALLVTGFITFSTPKSYTAATDLIVDGKGQDPISGQLLPTRLLAGYIATQADIVRSRNVAIKVIEQQNLAQDPAVLRDLRKVTKGETPSTSLLVGYLSDRLVVTPQRDSSVLEIAISMRDPALAARLADAFAQAYIQTNIELLIEPAKQITHWYDQQLATMRQDLVEKQNVLSAYQEEHKIIASPDRLDLETAKLNELSSMLIAAQGQRLDSESRSNQISESKRGSLNAQLMDNPQIQKLNTDLATAQTRLGELGSQVGVNHPQYRQVQSEVDAIKRQLSLTIELVGGSLRSTVELSQTRENQLRAELAAQKERVLQIDRTRNQLTLLRKEVENAQGAYDAALARATQTKLESRIASTDVAVLNTATVPTRPTAPKPAMNLLLALVVGLLAGAAVALCWEWMDRRVRSSDDLETVLGLPVLAYIPAQRSNRFTREAV